MKSSVPYALLRAHYLRGLNARESATACKKIEGYQGMSKRKVLRHLGSALLHPH